MSCRLYNFFFSRNRPWNHSLAEEINKNRANKRLLINERNNSPNNIVFCLCKSEQDYTNIFYMREREKEREKGRRREKEKE